MVLIPPSHLFNSTPSMSITTTVGKTVIPAALCCCCPSPTDESMLIIVEPYCFAKASTLGFSVISLSKIDSGNVTQIGLQNIANIDSVVAKIPTTRVGFGSSANRIASDSAITFEKWKGIDTRITTTQQRMIIGDTLYPTGSSIIFYGNSITQNVNHQLPISVAKTIAYPTLVAANLNAIEVNKGIGGTGLYGATCADSNMLCRYIIPYVSTTRYIMYLFGPQDGSTSGSIAFLICASV